MAHRFSDHVVGGIEAPRFLLVGPELSPNISFEEDLTGVSGTAGAYSRLLDTSALFWDYVLKVEDDPFATGEEYGRITIDTGAAVASKRYILTGWLRNDASSGDLVMRLRFGDPSDYNEQYFTLDEIWRPITIECVIPGDVTGNDLVLDIFPTNGGGGYTGAVRVDNIRCRQVMDYFELPLPARGNEDIQFVPEYQARNELLDGSTKSYLNGVRLSYSAKYDRLTAAQELVRGRLVSALYDIIFFPHQDSMQAYFVEWDDTYDRNWAEGVAALGHTGAVTLRGTELLPLLPAQIVDALTAYEPPADVLVTDDGEFIYV